MQPSSHSTRRRRGDPATKVRSAECALHAQPLAEHPAADQRHKQSGLLEQRRHRCHRCTRACLQRGDDGLFRSAGGDLDADPAARVQQGAIEGSNVGAVETMIAMISAARQFEQQLKVLQGAEQREQAVAKLLGGGG